MPTGIGIKRPRRLHDGLLDRARWAGTAMTPWAGVLIGTAMVLAAAIIRRAEGPRWPVLVLAGALVIAAVALAL
jgi:hypothetical protein